MLLIRRLNILIGALLVGNKRRVAKFLVIRQSEAILENLLLDIVS